MIFLMVSGNMSSWKLIRVGFLLGCMTITTEHRQLQSCEVKDVRWTIAVLQVTYASPPPTAKQRHVLGSETLRRGLHSGKFELETRFMLEFLANSNILNRSFPTNLGSILQRNPVCGRVCKLPRNLSIVRV